MNLMTLARARAGRDANPIGLALRALARRRARRRALLELRHLDDHLLRDIGLTRADLEIMRRQW
jgi:uncharacterized protein YjiS (DUF1127 family)